MTPFPDPSRQGADCRTDPAAPLAERPPTVTPVDICDDAIALLEAGWARQDALDAEGRSCNALSPRARRFSLDAAIRRAAYDLGGRHCRDRLDPGDTAGDALRALAGNLHAMLRKALPTGSPELVVFDKVCDSQEIAVAVLHSARASLPEYPGLRPRTATKRRRPGVHAFLVEGEEAAIPAARGAVLAHPRLRRGRALSCRRHPRRGQTLLRDVRLRRGRKRRGNTASGNAGASPGCSPPTARPTSGARSGASSKTRSIPLRRPLPLRPNEARRGRPPPAAHPSLSAKTPPGPARSRIEPAPPTVGTVLHGVGEPSDPEPGLSSPAGTAHQPRPVPVAGPRSPRGSASARPAGERPSSVSGGGPAGPGGRSSALSASRRSPVPSSTETAPCSTPRRRRTPSRVRPFPPPPSIRPPHRPVRSRAMPSSPRPGPCCRFWRPAGPSTPPPCGTP